MKHAVLLVLLLAACSGQRLTPAEVQARWTGRPVAEALERWGAPVSVVPDGQGGSMYTWAEERVNKWSAVGAALQAAGQAGQPDATWQANGQQVDVYQKPAPAPVRTYVESWSVLVRADGTIYRVILPR